MKIIKNIILMLAVFFVSAVFMGLTLGIGISKNLTLLGTFSLAILIIFIWVRISKKFNL